MMSVVNQATSYTLLQQQASVAKSKFNDLYYQKDMIQKATNISYDFRYFRLGQIAEQIETHTTVI